MKTWNLRNEEAQLLFDKVYLSSCLPFNRCCLMPRVGQHNHFFAKVHLFSLANIKDCGFIAWYCSLNVPNSDFLLAGIKKHMFETGTSTSLNHKSERLWFDKSKFGIDNFIHFIHVRIPQAKHVRISQFQCAWTKVIPLQISQIAFNTRIKRKLEEPSIASFPF